MQKTEKNKMAMSKAQKHQMNEKPLSYYTFHFVENVGLNLVKEERRHICIDIEITIMFLNRLNDIRIKKK